MLPSSDKYGVGQNSCSAALNPECWMVIDNNECSTGLCTSLLTQEAHLLQPDTVKHTYWLGIYQSRSIQDPEEITIRNGSGVLHPVWLTILTT